MTTPKFRMISAQESGIGGFLMLFVILLGISIVVALFRIPGCLSAISAANSLVAYYPPYPTVVEGELVYLIGQIAAGIIGLVLLLRKDRRAPTFFVGFYGALIGVTLIDMYFGSRLSDALHAALTEPGRLDAYDAAHRMARNQGISAIVWDAAWLQYWRTSERVRLTFTPGTGMMEIATPT
jgi:hypothetical protein